MHAPFVSRQTLLIHVLLREIVILTNVSYNLTIMLITKAGIVHAASNTPSTSVTGQLLVRSPCRQNGGYQIQLNNGICPCMCYIGLTYVDLNKHYYKEIKWAMQGKVVHTQCIICCGIQNTGFCVYMYNT